MGRRIEQAAIIRLAVNFDQHDAQLAQQAHAHRLRR